MPQRSISNRRIGISGPRRAFQCRRFLVRRGKRRQSRRLQRPGCDRCNRRGARDRSAPWWSGERRGWGREGVIRIEAQFEDSFRGQMLLARLFGQRRVFRPAQECHVDRDPQCADRRGRVTERSNELFRPDFGQYVRRRPAVTAPDFHDPALPVDQRRRETVGNGAGLRLDEDGKRFR